MNLKIALVILLLCSTFFISCKKDNYSCTYIVVENGLKYSITVELEKRTSKDIKEYTKAGYTCTIK